MSNRSDLPTTRLTHVPVVLAIGMSPVLTRRVREAAIAGQSLVAEADVSNAATMAAQTRALVLVLLEDVYAFDPKSWTALAADVRARIVILPDEDVEDVDLETMVVGAIVEAEAARESLSEPD